MVHLNKIYTKTGDAGETGLGSGERVPKTDLRIIAYGTVDELNSLLGVCLACELPAGFSEWLQSIQNDLFDLGADLCVPENPSPEDTKPENPQPLRLQAGQAFRIEKWIDEINADLKPLSSFILPGGVPAAAFLHLARTVCRRAEVEVYRLAERDPINNQTSIYLNRLSDLLFVLARKANNDGKDDVLWVPGSNRS